MATGIWKTPSADTHGNAESSWDTTGSKVDQLPLARPSSFWHDACRAFLWGDATPPATYRGWIGQCRGLECCTLAGLDSISTSW